MTAITGKVAATKRAGELGIHSMDTFTMTVPDLQVADDFYRAFGLDVREEGNTLGLYTFGSDHRWLSIAEGGRKKLNHLCFAIFEEDFEPMRKRIEQMGLRLMDAPRGVETNGFWFIDPFGIAIEVKQGRFRGRPFASLAHVLLFTPDIPKAIEFYSRALGLRLSDRSGDGICFMHGIHGSDHHLLAFAKSPAPGLHHCSWDMGGINEIGKGAMQMADKGYSRGWGMGRHVLGSNYFHYVRDPWGSYSEYSADIDYIPHDCDWQAGDFPPEDSIYLWGPEMPKDFVHNYETGDAQN